MKPPSRILIAYDYFPPIAEDLALAFREMGIDTKVFYSSDHEHWFYRNIIKRLNKLARNLKLIKKDVDLFAGHPFNRLNYLSTSLEAVYEAYQPDMIFFIHGQPYGNEFLSNLPIPKLGWWMEPNDDINELRVNAAPFDIYSSFSQKTIDLLRPEGYLVDYLCHSVNPKRFYPVSNMHKQYDICFVGNWSPWREDVINAALKVTKNIALYGPHWKRKSKINREDLNAIHRGNQILGEELNLLFSSSRIVLNASRIPDSNGLNMRFFEVLATQSCFLTDVPPELYQHFESGKHLYVFNDISELQHNIRILLNDGEMTNALGVNGYQHVMQAYTYRQMAGKLLAQYDFLMNCNKDSSGAKTNIKA